MQADSVLSKGSPGRQLRSVCVFMRPFLNVHKGKREGGGEGERVRVCVYERERGLPLLIMALIPLYS